MLRVSAPKHVGNGMKALQARLRCKATDFGFIACSRTATCSMLCTPATSAQLLWTRLLATYCPTFNAACPVLWEHADKQKVSFLFVLVPSGKHWSTRWTSTTDSTDSTGSVRTSLRSSFFVVSVDKACTRRIESVCTAGRKEAKATGLSVRNERRMVSQRISTRIQEMPLYC